MKKERENFWSLNNLSKLLGSFWLNQLISRAVNTWTVWHSSHEVGGAQGQSPNNFLLHSVAGSNECWTCVSEQRWNSAAWHFENKRSATEMGQAPEWQGRAIRRLLLLREIIQNLENDSVNFQCLAEVCLTSLTEDKRLSGGKETSLAKGLEPMDFTILWN